MKFSYNKLWKLLIDKNMIKKDLMEQANLTANTISAMGKGKSVTLDTLGRICKVLNCNIGEIVDVIFD